jgi:hypothetical protein
MLKLFYVEQFYILLSMARKKWTPKAEVNEAVLKSRAKRKWQIALRRYVIEKNPCYTYAPYFGLDIENFRKWIETQFDETLNWTNFSKNWQLDHIVPVANFDFESVSDLHLCWNFINVCVEKLESGKIREKHRDLDAAKSFFQQLYQKTNYALALEMVQKIDQIEKPTIETPLKQQHFINLHKYYLSKIVDFSDYEFSRLNYGIPLVEIFAERELLKKFQ